MHHRKGRDYQAANVGWLWKQRHVYTGGESDTNFTGTKEINKFGDSPAVGFVKDRYRFSWVTIPRYNLPASRWVLWTRRATANRNGTNTALQTASLSFPPHSSLSLSSSSKSGILGWGVTITNQTSQASDTFSVNFPTAQTVSIAQMALTLITQGTEVVMVKL